MTVWLVTLRGPDLGLTWCRVPCESREFAREFVAVLYGNGYAVIAVETVG